MSIEVKNINKSFESKKTEKLSVLEDINLTIDDGELVCLLGPSGCGKGTIVQEILKGGDCAVSVSATTRSPRCIIAFTWGSSLDSVLASCGQTAGHRPHSTQ